MSDRKESVQSAYSEMSSGTDSIPSPYYPPSLPPPPSPLPIIPPPPLFSFKSQRLRMAILMMLGLYTTVSMRLDLSMAVVCMVNSTAFPSTRAVSILHNGSHIPQTCIRTADELAEQGYNGTLLWSPQMQSFLFSSTFYGSLATILVSGTIADKFGAKLCFSMALITYTVVTFASPFLSELSFSAFFLSRIAMGVAEGFVLPSIGSMAGRWFPRNERSTCAAIYTSGNQLAASLSAIISSSLCTSILGWQAIFYLFGSIGVLFLVVWIIFSSNNPDNNPFISVHEALFLREAIQRKKKPGPLPWRAMAKSSAIYACLVAQFNYNFTATLLMAFLPTYFRDELMVPLAHNGVYTMIPFVTQLISKNILSIIADRLKTTNRLTATQTCMLFQTISCVGCALTFICLAVFPSCQRPWLAAIFLGFNGVFISAGIPGFFTAILSIAPQHSGTMTSLAMTSASIANVLAPLWLSVAMQLRTPYTWQIVFFTNSLLQIIAAIVFYFYGKERYESERRCSAEVQPWAVPHPEEGEDKASKISCIGRPTFTLH